MKGQKQQPIKPEVLWHEEQRTLTLEGEPVLDYQLSWPEVKGAGLGGRWISAYYSRLAQNWMQRWQKEIYWRACIQLSQLRAASKPFIPWAGQLKGEVTYCADGKLSIRLEGEERRGDARPCKVRWGDVWKVREGAPCQLKEFFPGERGVKKKLVNQILKQGSARREGGDCFLDPDWERTATKLMPKVDYCLTEEGLEFAFPQSTIAPAVEGTPVFSVPLS